MRHLSLFSGIGGFDLAAEWLGWENVAQVEINPFCLKVLEKNFPSTPRYEDIHTFPASNFTGRVDIVSGGFPCQPFSQAGARRGKDDDRYLWPEMLRVIQTIKPKYVVAENVRGILTLENGVVFEQVCADLENSGYEVQAFIIPAIAADAPHKRERVWFIGHANSIEHCEENERGISETKSLSEIDRKNNDSSRKFSRTNFNEDWQKNISELCGKNDGLPFELDRIKSLGNSIVPQVAFEIFSSLENL